LLDAGSRAISGPPWLCAHCAGRLQDLLTRVRERLRDSFLPARDAVTSDYWEWLQWRLGQVLRQAGGRMADSWALINQHRGPQVGGRGSHSAP
jgi:hypothetical protein